MESLRRIESQHSLRSKASRVLTAVSRRSWRSQKGEGIKRDPIPETDLDAGVVGWDAQDDPAMPLNFPQAKKWTLVGLLSAITLVTPFASSILSPGISHLMQDFGETNSIVGAMTVSIYLLGYVVGPMFLAPMSEIYGRRRVLTAANMFFCCWQIGCALAPNIKALIVFRFFSGIGGAGCLTLGGGVIADIFEVKQRGLGMSLWTVGPLFGMYAFPFGSLDCKKESAWSGTRTKMKTRTADENGRSYSRPPCRRVHRRDDRLAVELLDCVDTCGPDIRLD